MPGEIFKDDSSKLDTWGLSLNDKFEALELVKINDSLFCCLLSLYTNEADKHE